MIFSKYKHPVRTVVRDWLLDLPYQKAIAITLTFPPSVSDTRAAVEKHLRYYWNVVDKVVFGNRSARATPYRCSRVMFLEKGRRGVNFHAHGIAGVPQNQFAKPEYHDLDRYGLLLQDVWRKKMVFNKKRADIPCQIEPIKTTHNYSPEKWVNYISKTVNDWNWNALCLETTWSHDGPAA